MSRRGNCWDNAVSESFFGTLKTELLYELPLQTRGTTRNAVADYIENFYNVRRRHSSLDYLSPVEFELKNGALGGPGHQTRTSRVRSKSLRNAIGGGVAVRRTVAMMGRLALRGNAPRHSAIA